MAKSSWLAPPLAPVCAGLPTLLPSPLLLLPTTALFSVALTVSLLITLAWVTAFWVLPVLAALAT
jgi:hypothetical protein